MIRIFCIALVAFPLLCTTRALAEDDSEPPPELVVPEPPKADVADPKPVEPALRRALEVPDGFCKDDDYVLTPGERALCDVADAARARCPGFVRACQASATKSKSRTRAGGEHERGDGEGNGNGGRGHVGRRVRHGDDRQSDDGVTWSPETGALSELVGGIIQVIFWAVVIVGVGAMLWALVKGILGRKRDRKPDTEAVGGATAAPVPRLSPTGSPEELLLRARELAMAGELKAAMAVVLRALLRHFEIGGRLELHPSRTNGDYVRSLRQKGLDPRELRRVAAHVEAVEFGGAAPSSETFSALHAHVSKLVQVVAVVLCLLALGVMTGCKKKPPREGSVSSCGPGANGYSAFCETLAARGLKVRRRFSSIERVSDDVGRVVVIGDDISAVERQVLLKWAEEGGTLVVFDGAGSYDERLVASTPCSSELTLDRDAYKLPAFEHRFRLPKTRAFADVPGGNPLVRCGEAPFAVELTVGGGTVLAVADWRFPTNASLAIDENAALAATFAGPPGTTVELVGAWTGSGSEIPAESLARSGLLPWFLQILALGLALALYRGSPFGTRREPVTVTRRAFAEHAVALGDAYSRARASRMVLVNFGSWALERLRVRLQATKHGRLSDLAAAVAARHSVSEAEVMSLVVAVRSAEDQAHDSATETEHLAALRRLAALVKKTGGSS